MTEAEIKKKYGRYAVKATKGYKDKAVKILNKVYGSESRFNISVFDGCFTQIAVDNRKLKLLRECDR